MKKIYVISAAMVAFCSCTEVAEVNRPIGAETESVTVDINATISMPQNDGPTTRISTEYDDSAWDFKWEANDPVYCISPENNSGTEYQSVTLTQDSFSSGEATYTGTIAVALVYSMKGWCSLLYSKESKTFGDSRPFLDLSQQDGKLSDLYMMSDKEVGGSMTNNSLSFSATNPKLKHLGGFLDLNINYGDLPDSGWSGVTLESVVIKGVVSTADFKSESINDFNWDNPVYSNGNKDGFLDTGSMQGSDPTSIGYNLITVTPSGSENTVTEGGKLQLRVNVFPTDLKTNDAGIIVTLKFSNNKYYIYSKATTDSNDIERATFYKLSDSNSDYITVDYDDSSKWLSSFDGGVDYDSTDPSVEKTYNIANATQLKALSALSAMGAFAVDKNDHFTISGDINLSGEEWVPLCKDGFNGIFDGGNNEITGLTNTSGDDDNIALFAQNNESGTIQNVKLACSISAADNVAGIVSLNKGTVDECEVSGSITGSSKNVAGVVAVNEATVSNCTSTAVVTGTDSYSPVGGIVADNRGPITDCIAGDGTNGSVTGERYVGGIAGTNDESGIIDNCTSNVPVTGNFDYTGGITGDNDGGTVKNSTSTADVTGNGATGGIAGGNNGTIENCDKTSGDVSGSIYVGGIAGANLAGYSITGSDNHGNVTGTTNYTGGIVGTNSGSISECDKIGGTVSGNDDVGGIAGSAANGSASVKNCDSSATVEGNENVGGITGMVGLTTGSVITDQVLRCNNTGGVTGNKHVGGVVGCHKGFVQYCTNTGSVTGEGSSKTLIGGVVGYMDLGHCYNNSNAGAVSGASSIGGVAGHCDGDTFVIGCCNTASGGSTAEVSATGTMVGGVVGKNENGAVYGCYNTAAVSSTVSPTSYLGSVIGFEGDGATAVGNYYPDTLANDGIGQNSAAAADVAGNAEALTDANLKGNDGVGKLDDAINTYNGNASLDAAGWKEGESGAYPAIDIPAE